MEEPPRKMINASRKNRIKGGVLESLMVRRAQRSWLIRKTGSSWWQHMIRRKGCAPKSSLRQLVRRSARISTISLARMSVGGRIAPSTWRTAPSSTAAITSTSVSSSARRHGPLSSRQLVSLTHSRSSIPALVGLVPVGCARARTGHWRLVGWRVSGHGATRSRVRTAMRSHGRGATILRERVCW